MTRALVLDHEPYADPIDAAIALSEADPETRAWVARGIAQDEEWNGPRGDPGGDPIIMGEDAEGLHVLFAGRRVPALLDGDTVRLGIADRVGYCLAYALIACDRLLRDPEASGVALTLGRSYGMAQQTWADFTAGGRPFVLDLTLSEDPFLAEAYLAALHGVRGTSIPVPDLDTLRALYEIEGGQPFLSEEPAEAYETQRATRAEWQSRLSAAVSRQK